MKFGLLLLLTYFCVSTFLSWGSSSEHEPKYSSLKRESKLEKDDKKVVISYIKNFGFGQLEFVSERLKNDKDVVLAAFGFEGNELISFRNCEISSSIFKWIGDELWKDSSFKVQLAEECGYYFLHAFLYFNSGRNKVELGKEAFLKSFSRNHITHSFFKNQNRNNKFHLNYLHEKDRTAFRNDKDVVLAMVRQFGYEGVEVYGRLVNYQGTSTVFTNEFQTDVDVILAMFDHWDFGIYQSLTCRKDNVHIFLDSIPEIKNDQELFMMFMSTKCGDEREITVQKSPFFCDKDFVLELLERRTLKIELICYRLRDDKDIIRKFFPFPDYFVGIKYWGDSVISDQEFMTEVLIKYFPGERLDNQLSILQKIKSNFDSETRERMFLEAIQVDNLVFGYLWELRQKFQIPYLQNFVLESAKRNGYVLSHLTGHHFRNDKEIVLAAVKQNGKTIQFAGPELQNDVEVFLAASNQIDGLKEKKSYEQPQSHCVAKENMGLLSIVDFFLYYVILPCVFFFVLWVFKRIVFFGKKGKTE